MAIKMKLIPTEQGVILSSIQVFDPVLSCLCGQAFRWTNENGVLHGVVGSHVANIEKTEVGFLFRGTQEQEFNEVWRPYFDLDRDYKEICSTLSSDSYLSLAIGEYSGIRILKQNSWEALCSFIISQNNNIPRIAGIVSRLCEGFGEHLGGGDYSFPSSERIAALSLEDLAPLRAGFRGRYILDAAKKVSSGEVDLEQVEALPLEQARAELMKIVGVGAKVAECTLLYGMGRMDAFPVDVWVKRIMAELYPEGLPLCTKGVEGIAQQYLFHWRRMKESA